MKEENNYKTAPTWLYNRDGKSKFCKTQDEVDLAWASGWFGPPWLIKKRPLISKQELATKGDIQRAINEDPRYLNCTINVKRTLEEVINRVIEFEVENNIQETEIEE